MNSFNSRSFLIFTLTMLLTGCLQTRNSTRDAEEKQVLRKQVATLQQSNADVSSRFVDLEDESRRIIGRLEVLESKIQQSSQKNDQGSAQIEQRMKENDAAYREEFAAMRSEMQQLKAQLTALLEERNRIAINPEAAAPASSGKGSTAKGSFAIAEEKFEAKNWKEAILDYEKYRKGNPKGKQVPAATYKIGVAFQELGLADEAKAFYEEVISKHPKSKEAEKAQQRLKKLKN